MATDVMQKVFSNRDSKIGVVCQPAANGTAVRYTQDKAYQDQETRFTDRFDDKEYYIDREVEPEVNTSAFSSAFASGAFG